MPSTPNYRIIINKYISDLKKICGGNLLLVAVTGSISERDYIIGWSDIDLVVVLEKMIPEQLIKIGKLERVGVSVVGYNDFKSKIMAPKVKYGLKQKSCNIIFAKIKIPRINLQEITGDFKTVLTFYYGDVIKSATRGITSESVKKGIKLIFIMIKVIAREHGKNLRSYDDCIKFVKKIGLDYDIYQNLNNLRLKWNDVENFDSVMMDVLLAVEELFSYGKKILQKK
jgi:predicted nucleotidyltransferase